MKKKLKKDKPIKKVVIPLTKKQGKSMLKAKKPPTKVVIRPVQQELPISVTQAKPTLEQLSEKAAVTLTPLRKLLEISAQKEYEAAKFKEVKRLAEEAELSYKLIIATVDAKEEIKVKA